MTQTNNNQEKEKDKNKNKKKEQLVQSLNQSLQDQQLKQKISFLSQTLLDSDLNIRNSALIQIKDIVKSATTTMTSVPKPFKFLISHYPSLIQFYEKLPDSQYKKDFADFLSVLAMTFEDKSKRMSLKLLLQGTIKNYKEWGHEYISNLAAEIGKEYEERISKSQEYIYKLLELVKQIVPYFIDHNAQHDAIDLLMMVDRLEEIKKFVHHTNFEKIILYLKKSALYCTDQQEMNKTLIICYDIALDLNQFTTSLQMALKIDDFDRILNCFQKCKVPLVRKQLAFNMARQRIFIPNLNQQETKIVSNGMLTNFYIELGKDLQITPPKHPNQIYKLHLQQGKKNIDLDSAKQNLSSTYVNAFVNAGFKDDALLIKRGKELKEQPWIHKVKDDGKIAAVASIGLINIWDPQNGATDISEYLQLTDGYAKAGAALAVGIYNSGIVTQQDQAKAILYEYLTSKELYAKIGSILGLGIAYAGHARQDLQEILITYIVDTNIELQQSAFAALALGLIFVGKCNEQVAGAIVETLSQRKESELNSTMCRYFGLGLGLLFLGQQNKCEVTLETLQIINHPIKEYLQNIIEGCAFIGSGNVLKVQKMLHQIMEGKKFSQTAILSMTLIASSEQVGNQMCHRILNHILHYSTPETKKVVPLSLALLNLSNPKISVMDLLLKLAHDQDTQLSARAIIALGLIGAGTNNSRLADILRGLAGYIKSQNLMFCVRIAQGLLYLGKGMLSIQPYYSNNFLLNKVGMAGIIVFINSCLDMENIIMGKYHYMIFMLSLSLYPKMLFLINQNLQRMPLSVRVGQAIDAVGQAGKPKKITGFQTHECPVIIGYKERAEMVNQEYIPVQQCALQNIVIIKKNPNYIEQQKAVRKKTL